MPTVIFRTLSQQMISLDLDGATPISTCKDRLSGLLHVSPTVLRVIHKGRILPDSVPIDSLHLGASDFLVVHFPKPPAPPPPVDLRQTAAEIVRVEADERQRQEFGNVEEEYEEEEEEDGFEEEEMVGEEGTDLSILAEFNQEEREAIGRLMALGDFPLGQVVYIFLAANRNEIFAANLLFND
jgi:hypothetical protein